MVSATYTYINYIFFGLQLHGLQSTLLLNFGKRKENKMITERTLRKWRKEALHLSKDEGRMNSLGSRPVCELTGRILKLTQELLDQHLLRK